MTNNDIITPNWELLEAMTKFSDRSFEGWVKKKLIDLIAIDSDGNHKDLEALKWGLLEIIDHCINGSLCTGLILYAMQTEYDRIGGEARPPIEKTPWRKNERL